MRKLLVVLACLILVPIASARNYKADIFLNPTSPDVGIETTAYGCGYDANKLLWLALVFYPEYGGYDTGNDVYITTDDNGCFSYTFTPIGDGYYEIWAYQHNKAGSGWLLRSKLVFTIA